MRPSPGSLLEELGKGLGNLEGTGTPQKTIRVNYPIPLGVPRDELSTKEHTRAGPRPLHIFSRCAALYSCRSPNN
ncbi:mCG142306 [Mus musculus]|nr:mCG142306 [Mus musculus]